MRNKNRQITPQAQVLVMISRLPEEEQYEVVERAQRILRWREESRRHRAVKEDRCTGRLHAVAVEEFA